EEPGGDIGLGAAVAADRHRDSDPRRDPHGAVRGRGHYGRGSLPVPADSANSRAGAMSPTHSDWEREAMGSPGPSRDVVARPPPRSRPDHTLTLEMVAHAPGYDAGTAAEPRPRRPQSASAQQAASPSRRPAAVSPTPLATTRGASSYPAA